MAILTDKDFETTLTDADFGEPTTLTDADFSKSQPKSDGNLFTELFKGLGAGTEQALGQSLGSPFIALGESLQAEGIKDVIVGGKSIGKPKAGKAMVEWGTKIETFGTKIRDFFVENSLKGIEAPNKETMVAEFGKSNYGKRIAYSLGSSIPMMTAAIGVTAATKNPVLGASIFGPQAFGQFYDNARANGVEVDNAIGLSLANAVSQVGLEVIPLGGWLKKGGGLFKRVVRGAIQEGLVEEGSQQIVQNALEGIGWKGKEVNLLDGVIENIIVGTIMGAGMGTIPSSMTTEDLRFEIKNRITKEVLIDAKQQGLSLEQVKPVIDTLNQEIDKIDDEKIVNLSMKTQEEITGESTKALEEVIGIETAKEKESSELSQAKSIVRVSLEKAKFDPEIAQGMILQMKEDGKTTPEIVKAIGDIASSKNPESWSVQEAWSLRIVIDSGESLIEAPKAFAGQVEETPAITPAVQSPEIVRRSQIISDLGQRLNVPIRRGGFGGSERSTRNALGIYKPRPDIIRWKSGGVGTIAHEIGHFIDDNFADLNKIIRASRQEIGPLDYDATKQRADEGFSEFLRYWITQPKIALQKAPQFHAQFTQWLENNPEIKDILTSAQGQYQTWLAMSPLDKVKSQISFNPETQIKGHTLDNLYNRVVDDEAPLQRYVALAKKQGIQVTDENNPYVLARLFKGWVGKANHWLSRNTFDTKLKITGKGLKEILNPVKDDLEDFSAYLVSRRVPGLIERGKTTGITKEDALAAIVELDAKYPNFKKVAQELYEYQDRLLMYALESGLIKPESLVKMKELNQNYVPFYRVFEELQGKGYMGDTFANLSSPVKRMSYKGSERDIIDPIESIMKNTYAIINSSDRNAVGRAMITLSKQDKELGRLFEKIATPLTKVASVNLREEINKVIGETAIGDILGIKVGLNEDDLDMIIDIFRPSFAPSKDSVITVMQGGKKEFYYVDPEIYKALLGLEKEEMSMLIKILSYPARWLRAGATTLSPEFLARNPLRDQFSAYVYSKSGYIPVVDFVRGIFSLVGKDSLYWEWVRGGGEHSTIVSVDREYMRNSMVELFYRDWKDFINPLKWMQALSEAGEQGTRLGEFIRAREKGKGIKTSALSSRDVTLDFAKMGSKIKTWNKIAAFFNANIQGLFRPVQAFREAPAATAFKIFTSITLPSIILHLLNKDDERYKELPRWQKDLFWIIRIPATTTSGEILLRIPKPFELGIIFGSVPERIMEYIESKDPKAFDGLRDSILQGLPDPMPTAITPIIENITNYNMFTGRKLENMGVERLIPEERYTRFTSETAKKLGRMLGVSPIKIDNLVTGYTGGGGRLTMDILDYLVTGGKGSKLPLTIEDAPLIKGFIAREPVGSSSQSVNEFYENYDRITKVYNSIQEVKKRGDAVRYKELQQKYPMINYSLNHKIMDTASFLSDKRKQINKIIDNDKTNPAIKLKQIRILSIEMTQKAKQFNMSIKGAR